MKFLLDVLRKVLVFKFPQILQSGSERARLDNLSIFEAFESNEIPVQFTLSLKGRQLVETRDRRAFMDPASHQLWTKPNRLLTGDLAVEVSRLFPAIGDSLRPLARSVLEVGFDDEQLEVILREEGIPAGDIELVGDVPAPALPDNADPVLTEFPSPAAETGEAENDDQDQSGRKQYPKPPPPPPPPPNLIDPEEYFVLQRRTPAGHGHPQPSAITRSAKPAKDRQNQHKRPIPANRVSRSTSEKEKAAINLAMQVEESEGRIPEDVHDEPGIGYDILSEDPSSGRKIEIEVKMAGPGGPFVMQPTQWDRARVKGPDFLVYVVTGLLEGEQPRVYAISNPANMLHPAPPSHIEIMKWNTAAATLYAFDKRKKP